MSNINFDVITLFPKAFELINNLGVISRALDKNIIRGKKLFTGLDNKLTKLFTDIYNSENMKKSDFNRLEKQSKGTKRFICGHTKT